MKYKLQFVFDSAGLYKFYILSSLWLKTVLTCIRWYNVIHEVDQVFQTFQEITW